MATDIDRYEALNKIILRKYSRIPSICRRCQLEIDSRPAGQQHQIKIKSANDPAARPPCLVGPAAVCPAPPNTMRSVHGPRVRRRSAASPAVISRSAYTHGHTGKAREEPPRTEIERHRPAVEAPCRGLTAATQKVRIPCDVSFNCFRRPFLNCPARRRPNPLPFSTACSVGQRRQHPPRSHPRRA